MMTIGISPPSAEDVPPIVGSPENLYRAASFLYGILGAIREVSAAPPSGSADGDEKRNEIPAGAFSHSSQGILDCAREATLRSAVRHIRRMSGGAQAHLMRCDDDAYYVVKFKNNPQHLRTLANEMLATRLAARMGISVPDADVVDVRSPLIEQTPGLVVETSRGRLPCAAGSQFGSKFPGDPWTATIYASVTDRHLSSVHNLDHFLGIFVLDKWTCQTDRRQAIFVRDLKSAVRGTSVMTFQAMMIDHGYCFNGGDWDFPETPLFGLYFDRRVYQNVRGIEAFEPWLDRLENEISLAILNEIALEIPSEWYGEDHDAWARLIERLYIRRSRVRDLIWSTRNTVCHAFPDWTKRITSTPATRSTLLVKGVSQLLKQNSSKGGATGHESPPGERGCVICCATSPNSK